MNVTLDSIRDIQLYQSKTGYRFSLDSLLLYDFVNLGTVKSIADFGAGSGIVGILLAKKYPEAHVTLFEIQKNLAKLAEENVRLNSLENRVRIVRADIATLGRRNTFTLIVSNPPFRRLKSGRINIEEERAIARHEINLSLSDLVKAAANIAVAKGRFCVIYNPWRLAELIVTLRVNDFEPKRLRFVHSTPAAQAKMVLLEAVKGGNSGLKAERPLYIYRENGEYTEEIKRIYNHS
jgi:tRNA1Val (adenine37-N6)-methyltransferase